MIRALSDLPDAVASKPRASGDDPPGEVPGVFWAVVERVVF